MSDETLKKLIGDQSAVMAAARQAKTFKSQLVAATSAAEILKPKSAHTILEKELARHDAMMRAFAPLAELKASGALARLNDSVAEFERTKIMLEEIHARFRLPAVTETARLFRQFEESGVLRQARLAIEQTEGLRRAIEGMRLPWANIDNPLHSVAGMAGIQRMGLALGEMPAFGDRIADILRHDLGDWRDRISWPKPVFTDLTARTEFYIARGFDPALTEFPPPAFEEGLDIAGIRGEPPSVADAYGPPVPASSDDDEEEALARTNAAHDWLMRFETQLRQFIDAAMSAAYGSDWPKHRLPSKMFHAWVEKKQKAEADGAQAWPLICYADFTDYERVINKRDNWREVFSPIFGRPENVRESFQRLHIPRLSTMHSRPITQDDELLVYVEIRRMMNIILK